jgi:SAM-dependent MidA family methyltransferase
LNKFKKSTYNELVIYELGAGNGTMMENILEFISKSDLEVYKSTTYIIIEISKNLSGIQSRKRIISKHIDHIKIINKSIFNYGLICFN